MKDILHLLGSTVKVTVDRPLGSYHPKHKDIYYSVNYGYVIGLMAPDGEEQDAYILGVDVAVSEFTGKVIAIIQRRDDVEDKLVVAPENCIFSQKEIEQQTIFQEKYFKHTILMARDAVENRIVLRDMVQSDIEDYVQWFTDTSEQNDWMYWDAPWEKEETDAETERKSWTEYYAYLQTLPTDYTRWKFEIEADGRHIGWVSAYTDLGYVANAEQIPAIGIDIPNRAFRNCGYGKKAFVLFINYFKNKGYTSLYTQTWSGNIAMVKLAQSLGFKAHTRVVDMREVNGQKYDAVTFKIDL